MTSPIAWLRDNFEDNVVAPAWAGAAQTGSATYAETGGQARFTLPSSTAGSHVAYYATPTTYDLTGDGFYINIGTMVATGVAVTAYFELVYDATSYLIWTQTSGTLKAQTVVNGVITDRYSVAWNSSTYKYLRIRESGGNILFDSSSNGTSWTNRATVANPFSVVSLSVQFGAFCGNVASPGSFRLDDVNLISLATNWHMTQVEWPLLYRFRSISIATAAAASGQGYIATSNDGTTWAYYSGPLGSASGGYNSLTLQSAQAAAQAMAVDLPLDGRWDLPSIVECRFIRLYHRSVSGSSYTLREYYPRRLVQSDDVEAESIKAINIAAASITADKLFVLSLSAITASMGSLHMDGPIDITTGSLVGGGGKVTLDSQGLALEVGASYADLQSYRLVKADGTTFGGLGGAYNTGTQHSVDVRSRSITGEASNLGLYAQAPSGKLATVFMQVQSGLTNFPAISASTDNSTNAIVIDALNTSGSITLGSPTTATYGMKLPRSDGSALFAIDATSAGSALSIVNNGTATPFGGSRNFSGLVIISETAVNGTCAVFVVDGGSAVVLIAQSSANTWTTTSGTASRTNVYLVSGAVTIENKLGSTASYNVLALRTRTL